MDPFIETQITVNDPGRRHRIYLNLPVTPCFLQEVMDKLQLQEGERPVAEVLSCTWSSALNTLLKGSHDLYDLAALAQKIAQMDNRTGDMFGALLRMEENREHKAVPVSRLLALAENTGSCQVVPGIRGDSDLGRLRRTEEGGVFVAGVGYVTCPQEIPQTVQTTVPEQGAPGYTVLLEMQNGTQCRLPAAGPLPTGNFRCLDCVATDMADAISASTDIFKVQQLAETLAALPPKQLLLCRAAAAATGCPDLRRALFAAQHPDQFYLYTQIRTMEDVVHSELSLAVSSDIEEGLVAHLNVESYAKYILKKHNAALTDYGMVERVRYEPLLSDRVVLSDDEIEALQRETMTQTM